MMLVCLGKAVTAVDINVQMMVLCLEKAVTAVNINVQMMVVCLEKVKIYHAYMTPGTTQPLVTNPTSLTLVTSPGTRATCPIIRLR